MTVIRFLVLIPLLMLGFYGPAFSQFSLIPRWEAGILGGPIAYTGDLGGKIGPGVVFLKDYTWRSTRAAEGVYLGYHPVDWLGLRLSLIHGALAADDAWISPGTGGEEQARRNRNLDFRSPLYAAVVTTEIYPIVWFKKGSVKGLGDKVKPYVSLGAGLLHFNPQGLYTDPSGRSSWVNLRPLHTEGEGFPEYPGRKLYALTQLYIPVGVGATWFVDARWSISGEITYAKTFTDYIDDVSTTYVDPSLFYKHLSPTLAPIADYMSNKSPLRDTPGSGYHPGDKRGESGNKDGYFCFEVRVGFRFGRVFSPWAL